MTTILSRPIAVGLAVAVLSVPGFARAQDGYNRVVTIHNMTRKTIHYVRYSTTAASSYGPDRLGSRETIAPDGTRNFTMDDGTGACRYDVKVTYADESEAVIRNVNVCAVSHLDTRSHSIVVEN